MGLFPARNLCEKLCFLKSFQYDASRKFRQGADPVGADLRSQKDCHCCSLLLMSTMDFTWQTGPRTVTQKLSKAYRVAHCANTLEFQKHNCILGLPFDNETSAVT